jgi:hypothetical protein
MTKIIIALLTGVAGVATLLTGLGIDAWLHAQDETLAARECVFTLSNPGHLLLGIGMAMSCGGILSALYFAWGMTKAQGIFGRPWVRVISLQASGALSVGAIILALSVSASAHEHGVASDAPAASESHAHDSAIVHGSNGNVPADSIVLAPSVVPGSTHDDAAAVMVPHAHDDLGAATSLGQPSPAVTVDDEVAHTNSAPDVLATGAMAADDAPPADGASDDMHVHPDAMMPADGAAMSGAAHTHPEPTAEERACFVELTAEAKIATARFADINVAIAEGYMISEDSTKTHMPNRAYMRDGVTFDLANPETLVYRTDDSGERRFVGALYKAFKGQGPTPCGAATYWHTHGRCIASDGTKVEENKDKTCPAGYEHREGAIEMMHVWFVPRRQR